MQSDDIQSVRYMLQKQTEINRELQLQMASMRREMEDMKQMRGGGDGLGGGSGGGCGYGGSTMVGPWSGSSNYASGGMGQDYGGGYGGGKMPPMMRGGSDSRSGPYGGSSSSVGGSNGFSKHPGDWDCNSCGNLNYASRLKCNRCDKPKGEAQAGTRTVEAVIHGGSKVRGRDWVCPKCSNVNYASREKCNRKDCEWEKPEGYENPPREADIRLARGYTPLGREPGEPGGVPMGYGFRPDLASSMGGPSSMMGDQRSSWSSGGGNMSNDGYRGNRRQGDWDCKCFLFLLRIYSSHRLSIDCFRPKM